jgi:FkbM family methyltransferase
MLIEPTEDEPQTIIEKTFSLIRLIISYFPIPISTLMLKKSRTSPVYFALNEIDKQISKHLLDPEVVKFYIEVGANDGIAQSNTLHFEKYHKFNGILIEPTSKKFKELVINRSNNNHFFNCACVDFNYVKPTIQLIYSNLMTSAIYEINSEPQISKEKSELRALEHALKGKRFLKRGEVIKFFEVEARTLNDILIEANAPKIIGLLSVDVEGGELNLLNGVNFNTYIFQHIVVETENFIEIEKFFLEKGYICTIRLSDHDYLFKPVTKK